MRKLPCLLITIALSLALIMGCSESATTTTPESTSTTPESTSTAPASTSTAPVSSDSSNESITTAEVNDAIKVAEEYKIAEYEIKYSEDIISTESVQKRNEDLKPYLTENFYEKASNTRLTTIPLEVVYKQSISLKPEDLQIKLKEKKIIPKENNLKVVVLNYSLSLVFLDQEGKESNRIPIDGMLTLFETKGQWLIQGDAFDVDIFRPLIEK